MMNLAPLKHVLFIENVFTIFRNYMCIKKRSTRVIMLCWIIFSLFHLIFNLVTNFKHETEIQIHVQQIYYFSSTGFSIYVIIASLYYSKSFYRLLSNFDAFYNIFDDENYNHRMSLAQKGFTLVIVLFCSIEISVFTYVRVYYTDTTINTVIFASSQYNISVCDFRYVYEYFILRSIFFVISEQLRAITRSVDSELSSLKKNHRNMEHAAINHNKLNKWMKAYENINDSCNLFNSMFWIQLTIMLLIVTAYYIILLYTIAIITVQGIPMFSMLVMNLFSMLVFLLALFVISRGGQNIQNSSVLLKQKLCQLCLQTLENKEYYRLTMDLLRYVRTRPVRVHVFGTLDVNMSMLPSVVAFFTTYTVIALQFNNVL